MYYVKKKDKEVEYRSFGNKILRDRRTDWNNKNGNAKCNRYFNKEIKYDLYTTELHWGRRKSKRGIIDDIHFITTLENKIIVRKNINIK